MPKKILLADDSITIQKVVELTFSDGDYEVTAVNNGAKAIQKLADMRPDIILSDIIMPEKNGYEVCEYVKSHPEYRSIPVVLLTGTFEPFDPDRADKAGCDAVVTKPFESQSLIHKVEELIEQSRSNAPTIPTQAVTAPPEDAPAPPPPSPPPSQSSFSSAPSSGFAHDNDIFGAPPPAEAFSGETKAFPKMSFEDLSPKESTTEKVAAQPPAPSAPTPWEQPPAGETRAFPKMSFDEPPASSSSSDSDSPFGAPPPADAFSGETKAFPKLDFEEMKRMATPEPPPAPSTSSPWDEPPAFSGETKAFPKMSFEETPSPWESREPEQAPMKSEEPAWATPPPPPAPSSVTSSSSQSSSGNGMELTDDQIDRIARRVVQMMSDQVVRNIAWEVIPDLAEMVVKERIRQLEAE